MIRGIHETAPDVFEVTSEAPTHPGPARAWYHTKRFLLGRSLTSGRERRERLAWVVALAVLGADAIASSVYGPEELLRILAGAGAAVVTAWALPIGVAIVVLLGILALSYWQTIGAYPSGAGGYIVASENLGRLAGLVSAAALLIDYTLDVAVSVASGIQTITSTLAFLAPFRVVLALVALGLITLANLRGIRAAGALLSVPIYVYVVGTLGVVALGVYHWATGTLPPYTPPETAQDMLANPTEAFGVLLILRAFSSGAVALTGVEAISNGVPYFKPPEPRNAQRTLVALAVVFGLLIVGLSFLSGVMGVAPDPTETETVHSQITRTLLGSGPLYVVLEASALLLLVLAADTGFADFPRLLSLMAQDGILPAAFAVRGARLAFSNGIILVATISAALIVVFHSSVEALVPLFTVGAFGTFTLSQAGMARHWWRQRGSGWHWRMVVNGCGAAVTTVVLGVVILSKFTYGAWIVVVLLPILVLLLHTLGAHHDRVLRQLRVSSANGAQRVLGRPLRQRVLVMAGGIDRAVLHAVAFARTLDGELEVVHITDDAQRGEQLRSRWREMDVGVRLVVLHSPVRSTAHALSRYLDFLQIQHHLDSQCLVTVVIPELQPTRWWHPLVHNYFGWRLKWMLLFRPDTVVTSVPYATHD